MLIFCIYRTLLISIPVVVVSNGRILYHVISALTMTKLTNLSMETKSKALLFGAFIKNNIKNTIVKVLF